MVKEKITIRSAASKEHFGDSGLGRTCAPTFTTAHKLGYYGAERDRNKNLSSRDINYVLVKLIRGFCLETD